MRLRVLNSVTLIVACIAGSFLGMSQLQAKDYPVVGEPIPAFKLTDVHYYSKKVFDSGEMTGKWLILDFWNTACVACVRSFPKINQLQSEFKNHVQFLLIGQNDRKYNRNIAQIFERYRKNLGLKLAIAYDSVLFDRFQVYSTPHVIIVNPHGTVYAITVSSSLTKESLQALVANKQPAFLGKMDATGLKQGVPWNYLVSENDESPKDFLYRSVLSMNRGEPWGGSMEIDRYAARGFYQISRTDLSHLYCIAWLGKGSWPRWDEFYTKYWNTPVLEVSDPSQFQSDYGSAVYKGLYNYSLTLPMAQATRQRLMEVMQRDLRNYFGYEVSIEVRRMPCWKLTVMDKGRETLKSTSKSYTGKFGPTGIESKKLPMEILIGEIEKYSGVQTPYFDETGITEPIDISFSAIMTDIEDVKKALRTHGLILEKGEKEMKVVVIRDSKPAVVEQYLSN